MELLQAGLYCSVIALWLGHEPVETTQVHLHAHMTLKEAALVKVDPLGHAGITRYQPRDALLACLNEL
jgi:integrase/recombinase XerD